MAAASYGELLDAVRGMHWRARRAVASPMAGTQHSRLRGASAEFTEYRRYRQGDDPRRIDWRLLGRSDRTFVRIATDRVVLSTSIVLDRSASMAYPVSTRVKWRRAQEIVVGLAAVVHADGDPVGVVIPDARGNPRVVPPRTRRGVVGEIARVVGAVDPDGLGPLTPAFAAIRSARIAIVTDLLGDADDLLRAARAHVVSGGEVYVAHIVAREELDPPHRIMLAADPEQPDMQRLLAQSSRYEYDTAFSDWRCDMQRRWREAGAWYVPVITDEAAPRAIRRIVDSSGGGHGGQ